MNSETRPCLHASLAGDTANGLTNESSPYTNSAGFTQQEWQEIMTAQRKLIAKRLSLGGTGRNGNKR